MGIYRFFYQSRSVSWPALLVLMLSISCTSLAQRKASPVKEPTTAGPLSVQPPTVGYDTFYYQNDGLKLEGYLYRPAGPGPFPLVIYNHGSRQDHEREEKPMAFIADIFVPQGYAVLVPERRGYGKSEGKTYSDATNGDRAQIMMDRFHREASDVLAAFDYVKQNQGLIPGGHPHTVRDVGFIDFNRVALMGWSHGGVVSLLAASERHVFVGLVNQAGGSLTWNGSPTLQTELPAAGRLIKIPALCQDAENDATTDSVKKVGQAIKNSGEPETTIIYPPFTPTSDPSGTPPGHLIFAQGVSIWQQDVLDFLRPLLVRNTGVQQPIRRP
jgi:carboxymethylenebutenolidase